MVCQLICEDWGVALKTYPAVFDQDASYWKWEWEFCSGGIGGNLRSKDVFALSWSQNTILFKYLACSWYSKSSVLFIPKHTPKGNWSKVALPDQICSKMTECCNIWTDILPCTAFELKGEWKCKRLMLWTLNHSMFVLIKNAECQWMLLMPESCWFVWRRGSTCSCFL